MAKQHEEKERGEKRHRGSDYETKSNERRQKTVRCHTPPHNVIVICHCGTVEKYQRKTAASDKEDLIFRYYIFILLHTHTHTQSPKSWELCPFSSLLALAFSLLSLLLTFGIFPFKHMMQVCRGRDAHTHRPAPTPKTGLRMAVCDRVQYLHWSLSSTHMKTVDTQLW